MKKQEAIKIFGSQRALARALRISDAAVSRWPERVPELRAYQIRDILAAKLVLPGAEALRAEQSGARAHVQ